MLIVISVAGLRRRNKVCGQRLLHRACRNCGLVYVNPWLKMTSPFFLELLKGTDMEDDFKVFFMCATGLCNIILFLPAYQVLRTKLPNAKVTVALDSRWYDDPFFKHQFGDDVTFIRFPSKVDGLKAILQAVWYLRRQRFDLSFRAYSGHSKKLGLLMLMMGAKRTVFFETGMWVLDRSFAACLPIVEGEHYLERNLRQVKTLGIGGEVPGKWITISDGQVKELRHKKGTKTWVGIHAGVNAEFNPARQWPIIHFANLLDMILAESNTRVVLFGRGENERKMINFLMRQRDQHCLSVIDCPLDKVSAYLSLCDVFAGNDSGLMNLAVGLGVPTVAILGPTDPRHTGPYGKMHKIARLNLPCSPCYDKGLSLHCQDRRCLNDLKPEFVYALLHETLKDL